MLKKLCRNKLFNIIKLMKIGLVNPKSSMTGDSELHRIFNQINNISGFVDSVHNAIGSGLLIIAALTPDKHKITIIDENHEKTATTQQADRAYEIADEFRKRKIKVVIGGIHATVLPEEAKEHCDIVFVGEAEHTWPIFLSDFEKNKVKKFYHDSKPVDLTKIPTPKYEILNKEFYKVMWIQTSRGCPHDCSFCGASRIYGYKYRHKTVDQVIEEIKKVISIWPDIKIDFSDDNLFTNKLYAKDLLFEIKKLKINWYAQSDISIANNEMLLTELRDAGCLTLLIGFESISPENLKEINKNKWKLKQLVNYKDGIKKIQSKGIGILGAFVIGFDDDSVESLNQLSDFIIENRIFASQITILTPLPGTKAYDKIKSEGRFIGKPWKDHTFTQVTFQPKKMSIEELQKTLNEIYSKVYSLEARLLVMDHFKKIYKNII